MPAHNLGVPIHHTLKAWQHAQRLAVECAKAANRFPDVEQTALADQLRRACYSVPLNIAEGTTRRGTRDYRKFLDTAWGSLAEVQSAIAARLGAQVLLLTSNLDTIGQMSCNPAIGGIAKGTVVREIDALGGIMGRATDRATIQFRMLNRSKGPAVWAPRAQCDRTLYRRAVRSLLEGFSQLDLTQGMVTRLLTDGKRAAGVVTADGRSFRAHAVVLTAGTFLRGRIHLGTDTQIPAGRAGDQPAVDIAQHVEALGLTVSRFKTGTPPRVDGRSVDWSRVERQDGDGTAYRFSFYERAERPPQVPGWIPWAGEAVKDIIRG